MDHTVTIGFRFPDGEIVVRRNPTDEIADFMNDTRFFRGDRPYIQKFLAATPESTQQPLVPSGDGLVVVDFRHGRILSMQYEVTLGTLNASRLYPLDYLSDDEQAVFGSLLSEGRLSEQLRGPGFGDIIRQANVNAASLAELAEQAAAMDERNLALKETGEFGSRHWTYGVDVAPLVIEDFGAEILMADLLQGPRPLATSMAGRLQELGFDITEDQEAWKRFVEENA